MALGISMDANDNKMMKTDFLIIGGGVAGLSAAIRLAEEGADVTLLEGGAYPIQKICGEFLSPEALPILKKWNIPTTSPITKLKLVMPKNQWSMALPNPTATMLRYTLDEALAQRAEQSGAHVKTSAQVENIDVPKSEGKNYVVTLASGEQWTSPTLLVSTGRLTGTTKPKFCYIGAKAHFEGIDIPNELVMYLAKGSYFGMAPIGKNRVNVAGIIACTPEEALHPETTLSSFFKRVDAKQLVATLSGGKCLFDSWMTGPIPEFGIRQPPPWPNAYFLGDAAGVIPPATGNGLSMGLTSGILAAECALKGDSEKYRLLWNKEYRGRISTGMLLHKIFLSYWLSSSIPLVGGALPFLPNYLFRKTRGHC